MEGSSPQKGHAGGYLAAPFFAKQATGQDGQGPAYVVHESLLQACQADAKKGRRRHCLTLEQVVRLQKSGSGSWPSCKTWRRWHICGASL